MCSLIFLSFSLSFFYVSFSVFILYFLILSTSITALESIDHSSVVRDPWSLVRRRRRQGVGDAERAQQAAPGAGAPSRGGGGLVEAAEVAPAARSSPAGTPHDT